MLQHDISFRITVPQKYTPEYTLSTAWEFRRLDKRSYYALIYGNLEAFVRYSDFAVTYNMGNEL